MRNLPTVTRYLLVANLSMLLLSMLFQMRGLDLNAVLGLHYYAAPNFHFWQPFTYMFMHAGVGHLVCNMLAVWMFGMTLENSWGAKRYLTFYLICGLGAALTQECVWAIKVHHLLASYESTSVMLNYANHLTTVGASGAVFGILLAFGWLFPDVKMFLLFLPIPIRARVFVILYAVFELMAGLSGSPMDNVAHFAHLGGMFFGLLVILWWQYIQPKLNQIHWPWQHSNVLNSAKDKDYSGYHYRRNIE